MTIEMILENYSRQMTGSNKEYITSPRFSYTGPGLPLPREVTAVAEVPCTLLALLSRHRFVTMRSQDLEQGVIS